MMRELVEEIELHDEAPLNFEEYEWRSMDTAIYPGTLLYPILGLVGEAGEVAEKVKKHFRDGNHDDVQMSDPETEMSPEFRRELAKELGDVLWYVTAVASDIGYSLEEVAVLNLDKLQSRQDRDQLHGSGDDR
jgi:NTP pyrophosphatase (non-canonical NTP hydrolase)